MTTLNSTALRRRRSLSMGIAGAAIAAVVASGGLATLPAQARAAADPDDPSAAQGQIIQLPADLLGGLDVVNLGRTLTSNPSAPDAEVGTLDPALLELLDLRLGTLDIPLLADAAGRGLLRLGDLGAAQSRSHSPSRTQSSAASGTITSGGAIDIGAVDGSSDPARLELTDLLDQLDVAGLTDQILDRASVRIGALASRTELNAGALSSQYRIASLGIDVHSPAVAELSATLGSTIQGTVGAVDALVGDGGALTALVSTLVDAVDAIPTIPLVAAIDATGGTVAIAGLDTVGETVATEVLEEPVQNTTGSVLVDLSTGTVSVDLKKILVETDAGENVNSLPANTSVLTPEVIAAIQQGITTALTGTHPNSLNGKVATILRATLENLVTTIDVGVELSNPLTGLTLVSGDITVRGSLGQFAGTVATPPAVTTDISLVGLDLGRLLNPVTSAVVSAIAGTTGPLVAAAVDSVIPGVQPALAALTTPLLNALSPVLNGVLSQVVQLVINEQPTAEPTNAPRGDLPGRSFTTRALSVNLLPQVGGGVALDLASSTVKAVEEAATPTIIAGGPVAAGEDLPVSGEGWPSETVVTLQVTDADGNDIGGPVTVTTDANGNFPDATVYAIPAGTAAGEYLITGTEPGGGEATDTVVVSEASGEVNTNASASASASADADDASNASAQVAAQAAALADADSDASAAADVTAAAAAQSAATADASSTASASAEASAAVAAQAAARADASTAANADASTAANAAASAASEAAATADSSADASAEAAANVNASASASASAAADPDNDVAAQAAAVAAALADASSDQSAAADADAVAAAAAAARADASTAASADVDADATASAAAAAQAAARADVDANANAAASAAADASTAASASTAANATSSANASAAAAADADPDSQTNANASASAAASATADADNQAAATAAAQAAARADADDDASAAADVTAAAAAQAAATATASAAASADADDSAAASAAAAAQAAAHTDATSDANASSTAQANANASAAASVAANATSSNDASSTAAADSAATAAADPAASSSADGVAVAANASGTADAAATSGLAIAVKHPRVTRGDTQSATGSGFVPGEVVTAAMNSTRLALGTQVADARGTVTFSWVIPAGASLGAHTVTLTGAESGTASGAFEVVADGLAATGSGTPNALLALGILLVMLGLSAALVVRTRQRPRLSE